VQSRRDRHQRSQLVCSDHVTTFLPADADDVCVCIVGPTDCLLEGELLKLGGPFLQM